MRAAQVVDQVTKALYEQTMDAQEGVTDWLLDQMAAQHVKELLLAYYSLLLAGAPLFYQFLSNVLLRQGSCCLPGVRVCTLATALRADSDAT